MQKISDKSAAKYWKIAIIPILAFTIEEGLRWGRNIDWCVYYSVYNDYLRGFSSNHEILFQLIWKAYAALNLPYPAIIASCSCLLVFSIFYFCKPYKEVAYILIPFIIFMCSGTATNLIRWYMGYSFLLIAINRYQNNKTLLSFILCICSICTHIGFIIIIPLIYILLNYNKILLKPMFAILISVLLSILFNPSVLGTFSFVFDLFKGFDRFDTYSNDAVGWITGEGQNADSERRSTIGLLLASVPLWSYIIVGYKICKTYNLTKIYNFMLIGIFLKNIASGLELLGRYSYIFDPFICIIASYSIIYLFSQKKNSLNLLLLCISVSYFLRKIYVFCSPMEYDDLMHYVWDDQIAPHLLINLYKI